MPTSRLTKRRVNSIEPARKTRDVRDTVVRGFGVRVLPSGRKQYFLHSQVDGKRIWHSIGDAQDMILGCARERATSLLFEDVADEVFRRYKRHWKPGTLKVNKKYYRSKILPWFKGRAIGEITRQDVQRWFASLHTAPAAADRSAPVLSVIFRLAVVYGYRSEGSNPCTGIKRYRRRNRERFLNHDEIRRLSRVLDKKLERQPRMTVVVRLLLFTGCRKSEILTLKWTDYREGKLYLPDTKTGPRKIYLNNEARRIIARQPRTGSDYVFPQPSDPSLPVTARMSLWFTLRKRAGIEDVRLHDLRHNFASHAVLNGVPLPTVARLLGHRQVSMTLRYAHVADREVEAAAERIGTAIIGICGGDGGQQHPASTRPPRPFR